VILFGERSLRRALNEYVDHFHAERNHQGKGNVLLFPRDTGRGRDGPLAAASDWVGSCAAIFVRRRDGPNGRTNSLAIRDVSFKLSVWFSKVVGFGVWFSLAGAVVGAYRGVVLKNNQRK
jgi:hypothetical protein